MNQSKKKNQSLITQPSLIPCDENDKGSFDMIKNKIQEINKVSNSTKNKRKKTPGKGLSTADND